MLDFSKRRLSIHQKVFLSFASILLLNILVTLLFGHNMMEGLYIQSKSNELSDAYSAIVSVMEEQDTALAMQDALLDCIYEIEQNNINILILAVEDKEAQICYYTRRSWEMNNILPQAGLPIAPRDEALPPLPIPEKFGPNHWIAQASAQGIFQDAALPKLVIENNATEINQTMDYYGRYILEDTSVYIFLQTPKEAVSLAAGLAVKYNLYIALATFLLLTVTGYYISRRITRPIAAIGNAADRISKMDFTQPLTIKTGDELEDLSDNINSMAEKLQDYIYQMQLNHQLLEKDLEREAHTSRMRQEFIANVTHDFKTPLTLIRAYTETIRNQNMDAEEKVHYCDIILDESERLNHMVTQLLQLSRLESGMVQLELSFFSMEELLREAIYRNQLLIQNKKLSVRWDCEEEDHIVQGDYIRIEQVVMNLIDNAIKYTPEHGTILLSVLSEGALCRIAITNTCTPLSEQQLDNLFISFYKVDESRHKEQQSFGLGLAIVKATMELHGQTCKAANASDGLQIAFSLPLLEMEEETPEEED